MFTDATFNFLFNFLFLLTHNNYINISDYYFYFKNTYFGIFLFKIIDLFSYFGITFNEDNMKLKHHLFFHLGDVDFLYNETIVKNNYTICIFHWMDNTKLLFFVDYMVIVIDFLCDKGILNYLNSIVIFLLFFFYFSLFYFYIINKVDFSFITSNSYFVTKLLYSIEKNLGTLDDLKWYYLILGIFLFNSICYSYFINFFDIVHLPKYLFAVILFFIITVLPVYFILLNFSVCLFTFLRGSVKYNNLAANFFYDMLSLFAYFVRYSLQFVRWGLISSSYMLLHEMVMEDYINPSMLIPDWSMVVESKSIIYYFNFYFTNIFYIFYLFTRWLLEFCDLVLLLVLQTGAFLGIIFWLFNFLFSSNFKNKQENYLSKNK